uniref:Putative transglycosylase n=1 Tax=viral metagenome TaxID=1070528 RepID=A0A6H1Z9K2_9ZZZZ
MNRAAIHETGVLLLALALILVALCLLPSAESAPARPSRAAVEATIQRLAPQLKPETAREYADLVAFEARWYGLESARVLAYITVESGWGSRKVSKTNDYGLMQVHVSRRGAPRFLGREKDLLDPRTNVREGCRILAMWRRFHGRWCPAGHPWIAHVKWGRKIPARKGALSHSRRVKVVYDRINGWLAVGSKSEPTGSVAKPATVDGAAFVVEVK